MDVGFIGLGATGRPMARNLLVLKDMELATTSMASPPVLEAVEDVCRAAVEKGLGDADLSGLGSAARDHKERT